MMLRVWTDRQLAGHLDRHGSRGTTFVYAPKTAAARAVSITMPVRTASWDTEHGLAPIFDMNLPEGTLRAHLVRSFAKATGTFDDFDLLAVVGRTQVGRVRYSAAEAELTEDVPFQSIDEFCTRNAVANCSPICSTSLPSIRGSPASSQRS